MFRATLSVLVLFFEAIASGILLTIWLGASALMEQDYTPAQAQPGLELACELGLCALALLVGIVAARRKFLVVTGLQPLVVGLGVVLCVAQFSQ